MLGGRMRPKRFGCPRPANCVPPHQSDLKVDAHGSTDQTCRAASAANLLAAGVLWQRVDDTNCKHWLTLVGGDYDDCNNSSHTTQSV